MQFSLIEGWVERKGMTLGGGKRIYIRILFWRNNFKQWRRVPLLTWDSFLNAAVNVKAVFWNIWTHHFIMIQKKKKDPFLSTKYYFTYILHEKGHFGQWKRKKYNRSSIFCLILIKLCCLLYFLLFRCKVQNAVEKGVKFSKHSIIDMKQTSFYKVSEVLVGWVKLSFFYT